VIYIIVKAYLFTVGYWLDLGEFERFLCISMQCTTLETLLISVNVQVDLDTPVH